MTLPVIFDDASVLPNAEFVLTGGIPSSLTFTRASSAHRFNANGFIESVGNNVARIDYSPSSSLALGFLSESSRTNLLLHSNDFSNVVYTYFNASRTTPTATNLDGSGTCQALTENSLTANHFWAQAIAKAASSLAYSYTIFAKANGRSHITMQLTGIGGTNGANATFSLVDGSVTASGPFGTGFAITNTSSRNCGNGWWRCNLSITSNADTVLDCLMLLNNGSTTFYAGDGTSGVLLFGAQLEQANTSSSYIATTTASATRAADALSAVSTSFINETQGTMFARAVSSPMTVPATAILFNISDGTSSNRHLLFANATTGQARGSTSTGGVTQSNIATGTPTAETEYTIAYAYALNDMVASYNGGAVVTDTAGTMPTGLNSAVIGTAFMGWIKLVKYYNTRLPNNAVTGLR